MEEIYMSKFAENLRYFRRERNLSQLALGEKINVGYTMISMLESGRIIPDSEMVVVLANALDISPKELFKNSN